MLPFLAPKHVKQGRQFAKDARKLLAYKRDLWGAETVASFEGGIAALDRACAAGDRPEVEKTAAELDALCGKNVPRFEDAATRENCEVVLVAFIVALAVRTFFLQPFTIPTGSMQPTLNGIIGHATQTAAPNFFVKVAQGLFLGRSYVNVVAENNETISFVRETKSLLPFIGRTPFLHFGFFSRTEIVTDHGSYIVKENPDTVIRDFLGTNWFGRSYRAGEPIVRGYFDTGDHVFVDKFTYHFRKPRREEVFVFNTQTLPTGENKRAPDGPSQYYIKRLVGLPGDELRIDPPELFINGARAQGKGFERVMSAVNGYAGYGLGFPNFTMFILRSPKDLFVIPENHYFAMGDNSYHSSDSRDWGPVPQQNIMGRGLFVYWPFTSHWGLAR